MAEKEIRDLFANVELRAESDARVISGYAVVFDEPSQDLGGFIEYIDKGSFKDVNLDEVLLVYGHDINAPLARADSGTLEVKVDNKGLFFRAELPNTTLANDVLENIRFGNIRGMSFAFTTKADTWSWSKDDKPDVRHVTAIDEIFEITITALPAYQDTSVAIASRDASKQSAYTQRQRMRDELTLMRVRKEFM